MRSFRSLHRTNSQENDPPWILGPWLWDKMYQNPSCPSWEYDINKYIHASWSIYIYNIYIHIILYIYTCIHPSMFFHALTALLWFHPYPSTNLLQLRSSLSWLLGCTGGPSAKRLLPQVELRVIRLRQLPWLVVRATAKLLLRADITPWKRSDSEDLEMATSLTRHGLCEVFTMGLSWIDSSLCTIRVWKIHRRAIYIHIILHHNLQSDPVQVLLVSTWKKWATPLPTVAISGSKGPILPAKHPTCFELLTWTFERSSLLKA